MVLQILQAYLHAKQSSKTVYPDTLSLCLPKISSFPGRLTRFAECELLSSLAESSLYKQRWQAISMRAYRICEAFFTGIIQIASLVKKFQSI